MNDDQRCDLRAAALTRRRFLIGSGAAAVSVALPGLFDASGAAPHALRANYRRRAVARLSELDAGDALSFRYPYEHPVCRSQLFKLGQPAGGGVGPDHDVVAFNAVCAHQGGPLEGRFDAETQVYGPCPLHLTTFDLTRHGMVVSGHATESLPQVVLEVGADDDTVYAVGVQALIYGLHDNQVDPGT